MPVTDPIVMDLMGYSISIGLVVTMITQILKTVERIPVLSALKPVQMLVDAIDTGNVEQIRTFVGVLCVAANVASVYYTTGQFPALPIVLTSLMSFLGALGAYDFAFKTKKK